MSILVLHGPNLNMLGSREVSTYGTRSLKDIDTNLHNIASVHNIEIECFQSNFEGDLINKIQQAYQKHKIIIINPASLTHTSIGIRDAILAVQIPCIEVHLSNIFNREKFRHQSFISDIAIGVISGFGYGGYEMALTYAIDNFFKKVK